jgi:predicted dehydrogenase
VVDQYRIYQDTVAFFDSGSEPFDSTASTFYMDTSGVVGDTGIHYFYAVTAVFSGKESVPSSVVGEFDLNLITAP